MKSSFEAAYKELNPAQRAAVDAVEGPVLVVAGPGTGKTQLLSVRVANILKQTDTNAENILCLTFTNFAATNMRDRLNRLIGASAQRVNVRTFHSFSANIMSSYPNYFWNGARLSVAPDATQLEIIQTVLGELPLDNPLASRFAGTLTAISDAQRSISLAKEAGLTPEKLRAMLVVNEAYLDIIEPQLLELLAPALSAKKLPALAAAVMALPEQAISDSVIPLRSLSAVIKDSFEAAIMADENSNKTTNTGAWKKRWVQNLQGSRAMYDERARNTWWLALADVYETYRARLHSHGYYDYSDMVIEVITQLEQQPELRARVQERYQYVLIDEFQDTNAAQLRLAHLVASSFAAGDNPNLMAVGDDDQSIYAFNGAELNNMLNFRATYPATRLIVLSENYRSTPKILEVAGRIIEQADDRLVKRVPGLAKQLTAVTGHTPAMSEIKHWQYPSRDHQLLHIAEQIAEEWSSNDNASVVVLARSHDSLRRIAAELLKLDLPIRYEQQNNLLDGAVVQQISLLAELVVAIGAGNQQIVNTHIAKLLRYPAWRVKPTTLWQLAVANFTEPNWLGSLVQHEDETLVALGNWFLQLAQQLHEPLPLTLEYLLGLRTIDDYQSPLHQYYLANQAITGQYLEALSAVRLLTLLSQELVAEQPGSLADFSRFITLNKELGRSIADLSWFQSGERSIELMTVHKAKGLEFDSVYIVDLIEDFWQPKRLGRRPPANLPLQNYGELYDDYVRLLYVAASRAKRRLVVSSYQLSELGRPVLSSPLISSILAPQPVSSRQLPPAQIVLETALSWPRLDTADEQALLQPRLTDFRLSQTGLIQFLNVATAGPRYFLEHQILRLPETPNTAMAYGTAVHSALQTAQQLVNSNTFTMPALLAGYQESLRQQHLPQAEYERYLPHGQRILTELFMDKAYEFYKGGQAEVTLSDVYLGEARLTGKLDHVLLHGDHLLISDYKTGQPIGSFTTRAQNKQLKAWQHRTQLLFYVLLAKHSGRYPAVRSITAQMTYVEAAQLRDLVLPLQPSAEELQRLERLIQAVWQCIANLDFPDITAYTPDIQGVQAFEDALLAKFTDT